MPGFKLVLNSVYGVGTNENSQQFSYDFPSIQKDGVYELTWSFMAGTNDIDPPQVAEVRIDFAGMQSFSPSSSSNVCASAAGSIGLLFPTIANTTEAYFSAKASDNSPTYLRRPQRSDFVVSVFDAAGSPYLDTAGQQLASYILCLNFKYVGAV
jgi:hypothetical protein